MPIVKLNENAIRYAIREMKKERLSNDAHNQEID